MHLRKYRGVVATCPVDAPRNQSFHDAWHGEWRFTVSQAEVDANQVLLTEALGRTVQYHFYVEERS